MKITQHLTVAMYWELVDIYILLHFLMFVNTETNFPTGKRFIYTSCDLCSLFTPMLITNGAHFLKTS